MRFGGLVFRAHDPQRSWTPLSGEGARRHGGHFNQRGTPALNTSLAVLTPYARLSPWIGPSKHSHSVRASWTPSPSSTRWTKRHGTTGCSRWLKREPAAFRSDPVVRHRPRLAAAGSRPRCCRRKPPREPDASLLPRRAPRASAALGTSPLSRAGRTSRQGGP